MTRDRTRRTLSQLARQFVRELVRRGVLTRAEQLVGPGPGWRDSLARWLEPIQSGYRDDPQRVLDDLGQMWADTDSRCAWNPDSLAATERDRLLADRSVSRKLRRRVDDGGGWNPQTDTICLIALLLGRSPLSLVERIGSPAWLKIAGIHEGQVLINWHPAGGIQEPLGDTPLAKLRHALALPASFLAAVASVSPSAICRYEKGERKMGPALQLVLRSFLNTRCTDVLEVMDRAMELYVLWECADAATLCLPAHLALSISVGPGGLVLDTSETPNGVYLRERERITQFVAGRHT